MNNHHLFISIISILLIVSPVLSFECNRNTHRDKIPFDVKVRLSPFIVLGLSLNKYMDTNIPNLFNVTFLVQCILKGHSTQRIIKIVQAGSLLGRYACQRLDPNQEYIVFLEPFFDGTYRPVDFQEILYNHHINIVLSHTCGLSRIYPLLESDNIDELLTNKCPPAVSIDCLSGATETTTVTSSTTSTAPSSITSTTLSSTTTTAMTSTMVGKTTINWALLSLLLAEHQRQNLSLAYLNGENYKSLYSDDGIRKNHANHYSYMINLSFISFIFFSLFCRIKKVFLIHVCLCKENRILQHMCTLYFRVKWAI